MIRQFTWLDWYNRHPEFPMPINLQDTDLGQRMHVDHCIETLRLTLMCFADTTPLLLIKDPTETLGGRADFNTHHKCRKFENIRSWMDENQRKTAWQNVEIGDDIY
jgi:hypothetical protein